MNTENKKQNEAQKVVVFRAGTKQAAAGGSGPVVNVAMVLPRPASAGASALAVRPVHQLDRRMAGIPAIRISLYEGAVGVNGRKVPIPLGVSGTMTGKEFKRLANIYEGHALFVHRSGGMQRVHDKQSVEVIPNAEFTHRREQPEIRSVPRFSRD